MSTEFAITAQDVSKTYGNPAKSNSVQALQRVSLNVERGAVFGLLGPNGAGKTTLVKILLGLVKQSSGTATIVGRNTRDPDSRRVVGFLPESHRFPGFLTGSQMLSYYARLADVDQSLIRSRIPELLEQVDMLKWGDTKIKKYSKGMMQRIGLAQALMNDPDVIFLDEPTDGVDPIGRREIRRILQWLCDQGKTIFLNSHLLSEVEQICTEVAIMNQGQLAAQGSIAELTRVDGNYSLVVEEFGEIPHELKSILGEPISTQGNDLVAFRPQVKSREELNGLLKNLIQAGVAIESIEASKQTLEDSFISLLDRPVNDDV